MNDYVNILSQFPMLVILLGVLWKGYGLAKLQMSEQEERFISYLEDRNGKMEKALGELAKQLRANTLVLLEHDATVRGTNAEFVGTTQDIIDTLKTQGLKV